MMAHKLTKEELDQQFEQFLKESVSDDSFELGSSNKQPSVLDSLGKPSIQPVKKNPVSVTWWEKDDEDGGKETGNATKQRFTKAKNSYVVKNPHVENQERENAFLVPCKPTPKPRSKTLDRVNQLFNQKSTNNGCTNPEYNPVGKNVPSSYSSEEQRVCEDDPRQDLRSAPDDSSSTSGEMSPNHHNSKKESMENSDEESFEKGMSSSGKAFLKSLRKTPSIKEDDEEQPNEEDKDQRNPVIFSRDSLEPEDIVMSSGPDTRVGFLGLDVSDEEEKTRFLSNVKSSSSFDFSRPNQEREVSTPTFQQREEEIDATAEEDPNKHKDTASPAYSEDFEEEASEKTDEESHEKKPERQGMLAKVSLHDSLNSTDGALHLPAAIMSSEKDKCSNPSKTAVQPAVLSYGQSEGSEIEALQEAYRQINDSVGVCEERRAGGSGTPLSFSTLQRASTAESDLPTAEELMHPIGPDSAFTRGFSLQPIIEAAPPDSESHSPLKIPSDMSPFSSVNDSCGAGITSDDIIGGEDKGYFQYTQKRIAEEIKLLMQDQEPPSPPKPKKRQVPARSSVSARLSAPLRKAPAPSLKTKKPESRPLPRASAPSRKNQSAKPPSPLTQRRAQSQPLKKTQILNQTQTVKGLDTSLRLSDELVASAQSFATFLQHQVQAINLQDQSLHQEDRITPKAKTDGWVMEEENEPGLTSNQEHFRLQLAQKENERHLREEQLRQEHERELAALRKEIYVLQSKLHSAEEASKRQKWSLGEASDPLTEEKLKIIEKEMKEQETLIQGYHQENEKLYLQMKALQAESKQNEETLFMENQRLLTELAHTRDRLNNSNIQRSVKSIADQNFNIAELTSQVQAAQRNEDRLQEEIRRLKQEKQALHLDLEMMRKERDLAKAQAVYTSGDKSFELRMLQERHQEEVTELKKRLQWYAENQELLDKDAARLRAATAETQRLAEQVEKLKMEVNKGANEQQRKVKERAGESKRIQDLERQLKQMEDLLKSRHPNSLPALIFAAASAGEKEGGEGGHQPAAPRPSQTAALLERRVHRLEAELEGRDEAAKRSLRTMEQQYHRIKFQYEQQITDLEQRLAERSQTNTSATSPESQSQIQALKEEIEELKRTYQNREIDLQAEVASLQEQLHQAEASSSTADKPARSPSRHQVQAEAAQASRIERLTQELNTKSRTIQELSRTVDRLQRERRTMLSAPGFDKNTNEHRRQSGAAKVTKKNADTFPPTQDEKDYHPGAFAGSHISEVQLENDSLRARLEELEIQKEQERVSLQAAVTQAQAQLLRTQEQNAQQLASFKAEHHREIERLLASHALEHSSSRVAELTNQVNTQEIIVQHLQAQVKELQGAKDALTVSKIREDTLQNQLSKLLEELKEAKEAHSPNLRHFTSLEHKIQTMELRYSQREKQLQQVIADTRQVVEQEQRGEVERWRRIAQGRAKELEAFRLELDSILDVLRELQRQGVVIPASAHSSTSAHAYLPLRF